jgi:hypothetical protein
MCVAEVKSTELLIKFREKLEKQSISILFNFTLLNFSALKQTNKNLTDYVYIRIVLDYVKSIS